jgi:hypothetical protein
MASTPLTSERLLRFPAKAAKRAIAVARRSENGRSSAAAGAAAQAGGRAGDLKRFLAKAAAP